MRFNRVSPVVVKSWTFGASLALLGLAIYLDKILGPHASVLLVYIVSIAAVSWLITPKLGYPWSVLCALIRYQMHTNEPLWSQQHDLLHWNFSVEVVSFLIFTLILAVLQEQIASEQDLARTDALTRVRNRRAFIEMAEVELDRARRYPHPITAIYIDVDDFKQVNDTKGHKAGDAVLRIIGETLARHSRRADLVARLGGDEFAMMLPETGVEGGRAAVSRMQQKLHENMAVQGWNVGFSIGYVTFDTPPASVDEMLQRADDAMYKAKKDGKNHAEFALVA